MADSIAANWAEVRERVEAAAKRSGRAGSDVKIVAVTKTVDLATIRSAVPLGITDLGENRVQEAADKFGKITNVCWHMIGHLQRNKVKAALEIFSLIHSLDSLRLALEIEKQASSLEKTVDVLLQVNVSGEDTKYGVSPGEVDGLLRTIAPLPHIRVRGLMTIAPFVGPEEVRPVFAQLRQLKDRIVEMSIPGVAMDFLSMGMSNDFEVAIEEGANIVRIGSAIFGPRR